jgi:hypothetical protein
MAQKISDTERCLNWSVDPDCVERWDTTIFTWSDCELIDELLPDLPDNLGAMPGSYYPQWATGSMDDLDEKDKKKKKRVIQLIAFVRDQKIIEEKEVVDMEIKIEDVRLVKKKIDKTLNVRLGE